MAEIDGEGQPRTDFESEDTKKQIRRTFQDENKKHAMKPNGTWEEPSTAEPKKYEIPCPGKTRGKYQNSRGGKKLLPK